jgi:LysM domain
MAAAADFSPTPSTPSSDRSGRSCRFDPPSRRRLPVSTSTDHGAILRLPSRAASGRCRVRWTSSRHRGSLPVDIETGLDLAHAAGALDRAPDAPPLRLTRRGVVVLAGVTALIALALLVLARASAPHDAGSVRPASSVTVQAGDTLWSIASVVAPTRDPREVVAELMRLNRLTSSDVAAGQQLRTR